MPKKSTRGLLKPNRNTIKLGQVFEITETSLPLYRLVDAEDYWGNILVLPISDDLGMVRTAEDFSLSFKTIESALHGIMGIHIDDKKLEIAMRLSSVRKAS